MKHLTFTDDAKKRIAKYLSPDKTIVLDFDDGVGPFSAIGNCNLDANYRLIFVKKGMDLHDFDEKVESNIGDIYIKSEPYANSQFENLEVVDLTEPVSTEYRGTHDC